MQNFSTDFEEKHQEPKINICFNSWEALEYFEYYIKTSVESQLIIDLLNVAAWFT